jgi:preprotein translocase subunit SecY
VATNAAQLAKTGKFGDLRRRLVFLLLALVVYRVGAHIPVPGIDPAQLQQFFKGQQGGILGMFNMLSGGACRGSRVCAGDHAVHLGVDHHAVADLCAADVRAAQEGRRSGRRKITQYTRYGTLGLAFVPVAGHCVALEALRGLVIEPGLRFSA